jgi:AraC-like DNA-binding protein
VRCIWRLRGDAIIGGPPEPIIPDGCAEIVLNFGDPFVRHGAEGSHRQPLRLLAGQITRAITIQPSGRLDLWGIRFHPWSAAAFFGISGAEMRDELEPLDAIGRSLERELASAGESDSETVQRARIEATLLRQARRARTMDARTEKLVRFTASAGTEMSVRGLARASGLSERRVQMIFRDDVGLSPKQTMRIQRFQRALALRRANDGLTWSAVAARAGYHDQAHLIHESRDIAGCTPGELLGRDDGLTEAFLQD